MEKCVKCEEEVGFNRLHINGHINDWLCLECNDLYLKELEVFNKNFIQPERSKREDALKECEQMGHINTWMPKNQVLCMRCGALNTMET